MVAAISDQQNNKKVAMYQDIFSFQYDNQFSEPTGGFSSKH
jgi:hypothetical protein